jgi:hypothetical protein
VRYTEDLRQSELFDAFESILSPLAYSKLQHGWQHLFRCAILKLLPAKKLGEHFDPALGRPTKELYSMAGLLFIMEFRDWTHTARFAQRIRVLDLLKAFPSLAVAA